MTPAGGVSLTAPAKINLYLHVTGRRDDGYHLLDSLVAFAGIHDIVSARPADDFSLAVDGPFADGLPAEADNLVLRAARRLATAAGIERGAALSLTKRLPAAAGLGGGSSDAASTLKALDDLWGLHMADSALAELALELGADVPVCLAARAAFVGGIGEKLAPAPALPTAWLVLVNPRVALSTPRVFAARGGGFSDDGRFAYSPGDAGELAALLQARRNDLTEAAIALEPAVGEALAALAAAPEALLWRMTGSGATCFGLFADVDAATQAALALGRAHPDWWIKPATLEGNIARRQP